MYCLQLFGPAYSGCARVPAMGKIKPIYVAGGRVMKLATAFIQIGAFIAGMYLNDDHYKNYCSDYHYADAALTLARQLDQQALFKGAGKELFTSCGRFCKGASGSWVGIFLNLKTMMSQRLRPGCSRQQQPMFGWSMCTHRVGGQ